jgi:uncharacterized protein YbbC (DUF1343 family)
VVLACGYAVDSEQRNQSKPEKQAIEVGASQTELYLPNLKGKKVGVVVNQTSVVNGTHLVDTLLKLGIDLHTIFAPEHGFRGDHSAGAKVSNGRDPQTGLPITSLYGKYRKPSNEMIEPLDVVIFDIQDVGVRFYTYISTMHYVMEMCASLGKEVIVLDRPNPNGFYIDGPIREDELKSFIGMHPIPLVHGLTVGELAQMIVGERWIPEAESLQLTVIPCKNYNHDSLYALPIAPSPNLPSMESVYLYPTLGLFEGTRMSIGRGTDQPFELLGMPNGEGDIRFEPKKIPGVADHPKFEGQSCIGVDLSNYADSVILHKRLYLEWLPLYYQLNVLKETDESFFLGSFNKLAGTSSLKQAIVNKQAMDLFIQNYQGELQQFRKMRANYLLYPDFKN